MNWLINHWEELSFGLLVLINLLNAATQHFSTHAGVVKWLLFIIEELSIIRSAGSVAGVMGNLKAPMQNITQLPIKGDTKKILPFVLLFILPLGACSSTLSQTCQRSLVALGAIDAIVIPVINQRCMTEAKKCADTKISECTAWKECDRNRMAYKVAMDSAGKNIADVNRVIYDLGLEKEQVSK